jgi:hypothetical protein
MSADLGRSWGRKGPCPCLGTHPRRPKEPPPTHQVTSNPSPKQALRRRWSCIWPSRSSLASPTPPPAQQGRGCATHHRHAHAEAPRRHARHPARRHHRQWTTRAATTAQGRGRPYDALWRRRGEGRWEEGWCGGAPPEYKYIA